ncbi:MAG: GerW family sporulation protein [Candidatus Aminicenantales bacterium]
MRKRIPLVFLVGLVFLGAPLVYSQAQKKTQPKAPLPMDQLADSLAQRLTNNLDVKNIVGEPIKIGKVTIIPIMMIELGFGGGGGGAPQNLDLGGKGFFMSGEAKPIGFVAISKAGTQFIHVAKIPHK